MKLNFKALAGFMAAALAVVSCGGNKKAEQSEAAKTAAAEVLPKVTVVKAVRQSVKHDGTYTATVQANIVNNIAPQSVNRIKTINVEIGDFVSRGQVLARMDVANLEQTKLQLQNDSTELARIKGLYEVGGVSKSDLDAIQLSYNVRKTAYSNLLENTILRSPVSGVVTARNYDKGDMYSMSQPLFTVQEITPVKLLVGISESDYTKVKKGDKVSLTVEALPGQTFEGRIERLYPTIDPATHTFTIEVKVPNRDRKLRPGMYAKVSVSFGDTNSIVVPDRALVRQQGSGDKYIYVYNADTKVVTMNKIELGVRFDTDAEILSGIGENDYVVTEGQIRIKDGVEVDATIE